MDRIASSFPKTQWEREVVRLRNNTAIAVRYGAPLSSKYGSSTSGWLKIFRGKR